MAGGNKGEILFRETCPGEIGALFGEKSGEIGALFASYSITTTSFKATYANAHTSYPFLYPLYPLLSKKFLPPHQSRSLPLA
jgi:hypothetical protein